MKKIASAFALLVLGASVQGASINWTVGGAANAVLTDYAGNIAAGQTVYLTLGDASSIASITGLESKEEFDSALSAITIASATTAADGKKPTISNIPYDSGLLVAGTQYTFSILFASEDADGNGYFKYITSTGLAYTTGDTQNAKVVSTNFKNLASSSDWKAGYTSVPEPATAALALLGVGMLLKRRKA